jgi:epoxide hydrolase-like predicted phosphatase
MTCTRSSRTASAWTNGSCRRSWPTCGASTSAPRTELIEFASRLRPRYRTGILSNSFVGAREREQQAYGFEDLVDEIVYSHESEMGKPDPRIYALACARLGVRPEEAVFLDDHDPFVTAAREAGLHAVRYQGNAQAIADIEELLGSGRYGGSGVQL